MIELLQLLGVIVSVYLPEHVGEIAEKLASRRALRLTPGAA